MKARCEAHRTVSAQRLGRARLGRARLGRVFLKQRNHRRMEASFTWVIVCPDFARAIWFMLVSLLMVLFFILPSGRVSDDKSSLTLMDARLK